MNFLVRNFIKLLPEFPTLEIVISHGDIKDLGISKEFFKKTH